MSEDFEDWVIPKKALTLPKGFTLNNAVMAAYLLLAGFLAWSLYQSRKSAKVSDAYFADAMDRIKSRVGDAGPTDVKDGMGFKLRSVPTTSDNEHPTTGNDAS